MSKTVPLSKLVDIDKIKTKCIWYTTDNEINVKIEYIAKHENISRRLTFVVDIENSIYNDEYKMMFYNILNENDILMTESLNFSDCYIKSFGFGEDIITYLVRLLR